MLALVNTLAINVFHLIFYFLFRPMEHAVFFFSVYAKAHVLLPNKNVFDQLGSPL